MNETLPKKEEVQSKPKEAKETFDPKKFLAPFLKNNPYAEVTLEEKSIFINRPWGRDDARLKISLDDVRFLDSLNDLQFNSRFDAIIHLKTNTIEFVFGHVDPAVESGIGYLDREFEFHFEGEIYKCFYGTPTKTLYEVAKSFERLPAESIITVPQIQSFKDSQNLEYISEKKREFLEKRIPRSFFIESNSSLERKNLVTLARHINFLSSYYDRSCPIIIINRDISEELPASKRHLRFIEDSFPKQMLGRPIDDIVLKLLEVADNNAPRFSFIYYYQVLEYAAHYYMDAEAKDLIRNLLKDPTIISCSEEKFSAFFSALINLNYADDAKMKKIIDNYCNPSVIWKEIENNKSFFTQHHNFDGGFSISPIISDCTTEESWKSMWSPKLYDTLTKIRNAVVHAREKRENKVVLPTRKNNILLEQYKPIIRRVAEQIAIKAST